MKVFIISHGYYYDGYNLVSAHKSYETAEKKVQELISKETGDWKQFSPTSWNNGAEFYDIDELTVEL